MEFWKKININPTQVYNKNEAEIQGFPLMYQVLRKYARKIIVYIIKIDESFWKAQSFWCFCC